MSAVSSSSPSSKKRRRPNLDPSRPLHVTTNVKSTGLGDAAAALPRSLGQGKRRVWCGSAAAASMLLEASTTAPPAAPRPVVESLRSLKVRSLTKLVNTLCHDANGAAPPVLALERWLLNALASHDDEEELGEASRADPLLPGGGGGGGGGDESFAMRAANDNLVADLIRGSIPAKVATQIAGKVAAASVAAAAEVAALERRLGAGSEGSSKSKKKKRKKKQQQPVAEGGGQQQGAPDVMVEEHRHSVDVYLPGKGKHVLKLNHEHYQKLRGLWDLRQVERRDSDAGTGGDAGARVDADADADADASADIGGHDADRRFRDALFVLLSRYFALQGRGFQAACSEHVQELLGDELKVTHECFASPLNCYFPSFNSAFIDTDAPFGSAGSFFKWRPAPTRGGSYEANPPFVADVMLSMAQRIDSLLGGEAYADVGGRAPPLSFTVIVPGWLEDAGIQHLKASPFKRLEVAVPKEDHGFCDGAQHQRRDRYLASPFDTIVFVLQNKEGAAKYPIPKGFKRSLLAAFAMSKPTTAAVERRMKAGRGFAAEDGGGGVYKGKKAGGNLKGGEKRKSGAVGSEGGAPEKRPRLKHPRPQAKSEPKPKPKLKPKANQPRARQLPPKQQQRRQPQPQPPKAKAKAHQKAQKQKQHDPNRVVEF